MKTLLHAMIDVALIGMLVIALWGIFDMDGTANLILDIGRMLYPILPG